MFSRQHYKEFAEILRKISDRKSQLEATAATILIFKKDNPRFDTDIFLKAVGLEYSPALKQAMGESKVNESFEGDMKLVPLLPSGRITTLRHGGSAKPITEAPGRRPNEQEMRDMADDFEGNFDEIDKEISEFIEERFMDFRQTGTYNIFQAQFRKMVVELRRALMKFSDDYHKMVSTEAMHWSSDPNL